MFLNQRAAKKLKALQQQLEEAFETCVQRTQTDTPMPTLESSDRALFTNTSGKNGTNYSCIVTLRCTHDTSTKDQPKKFKKFQIQPAIETYAGFHFKLYCGVPNRTQNTE